MTAAEFIRDLPQKFNTEAVPEVESCLHFMISGEGGGDFTVNIRDRKCSVQDGLHDSPKCTYRTSDQTLVDIVTGKQNSQMAVFMGKLKISNLAEHMKFARVLGIL